MKSVDMAFRNEIAARYAERIDDEFRGVSMQQMSDALGEDAIIQAIFSNCYIKRCKLCGKPFITKNRRAIYCDNYYDEKHTCKAIGASRTREKDPVNKVMDAARRLHLRRRKVALKTEPKTADDNYNKWLEYALENEKACRAGKVSLDELKDSVGRNYTEDIINDSYRVKGDR